MTTNKTSKTNSVKKETSTIKAINKALIDRDITKIFKSGYYACSNDYRDEIRACLDINQRY